jgi:LPS export ABC transporter protein LptC
MNGRMRAEFAPLAMAALLAACDGGPGGPTGVGYIELPADQVFVDVTQSLNTAGVRAALLRADTVYMFNDSAKAHLRILDLTVYDEDGVVKTTVRSQRGELHTVTEAMVARGNVVVVTDAGARRIETEELHYDPSRNQIWSDVPFVMHENGSVTRGQSFRSDSEFRNFEAIGATGRIPGLRFQF